MGFEVTLAHKRSDKLDITKGAFIQPKLDGVRCYTRMVDGEIKMFSRNHKEFKNVKHLTTELNDFFRIYPNVILDGELYNHKYRNNFNEIISIVRTSKPTQADRFKSASHLEYHLYDTYDYENWYDKYTTRLTKLRMYQFDCMWRKIKIVDTHDIYHTDDITHHEEKFLDLGYEGAMLRANIEYEQKRSHGLQKVKRFLDDEFKIIGAIEGKGKFSGGLGKWLGVDKEGRPVEIPFQKCTIERRKKIWKNRANFIGKWATFTYFERTPDNAYRFPQYKELRDYEG